MTSNILFIYSYIILSAELASVKCHSWCDDVLFIQMYVYLPRHSYRIRQIWSTFFHFHIIQHFQFLFKFFYTILVRLYPIWCSKSGQEFICTIFFPISATFHWFSSDIQYIIIWFLLYPLWYSVLLVLWTIVMCHLPVSTLLLLFFLVAYTSQYFHGLCEFLLCIGYSTGWSM